MEKDIDEPCEPLLERSMTDDPGNEWKGQPRTTFAQMILGVLILVLLVYNSVVVTMSVLQRARETSAIYSPARVALHPEVYGAWDSETSSPWVHGSRAEVDSAWEDLLTGLTIRVSEEDMYETQKGFGDVQDAVRLSDGDYVGVLGVYHYLHCLDLMRVALNRNTFNSSYLTDPENVDALNVEHFEHCIDAIRHNVMCQPDLTVYRLTWIKSSREYNDKALRSGSQRECMNWDSIASWANNRALDQLSWDVRPGPYDHE